MRDGDGDGDEDGLAFKRLGRWSELQCGRQARSLLSPNRLREVQERSIVSIFDVPVGER